MNRRLAIVACAVAPAWLLASACILAQSPAPLPVLPDMRPTIQRTAVVPSASRVLLSFPPEFVVPVELLDPSRTFEWRVFIDYDPLSRTDAVLDGRSDPDPADASVPVRRVTFSIEPPDLEQGRAECHVVEFLVAYSFRGSTAHAPDPTGGDSVTWFYNPSGDLSGCPSFDGGALDAGADGDAGTDADDAGDAGAD
jgi:hypothetical protein